MNIFNPVTSKDLQYSGLLMTDEALFYKVHSDLSDGTWDRVFITKDPEAVCKLLELDHKEIENANEQEFFAIIAQSERFKLSKFKVEKEKNHKMLVKFSDFLNSTDIELNTSFVKIGFESYCNLSETFQEDVIVSLTWIERRNEGLKNLNGHTIKAYFPDYNMRNLSTTIPEFKKSFDTRKELELFLVLEDNKSIHEEFMKRTEKYL